jgi:hypothetical protein
LAVAGGSEVVVMLSTPCIVILKLAVAERDFESVTLTLKGNTPAAEGVPLIMPVLLFNVRPPGRLPEETLQVNGAVPPLAESVVL